MDNPLLYRLFDELRLQIRFAQRAQASLPKVIQNNDPEGVFFYIGAFLAHAIDVSRLLWPDNPEARERGERLRAELKVTTPSPLELKELRALLVRSDEKLVEWAAASEHRNFVQINMMPQGTLAGFQQDVFQRSFDPDTFRGSYQGVPFDVRLVWKELQRLDLAAQNWLKTHNPW
ncbi:MAG: hypothetical protein AB1705_20630 [Verrucomicrobiota bacterium]